MKYTERDQFDDLLRSKLYDYEADAGTGGWEAIESRLDARGKLVRMRKAWSYAAAVVALLLAGGGVYFYTDSSRKDAPLAGTISEIKQINRQNQQNLQNMPSEQPLANVIPAASLREVALPQTQGVAVEAFEEAAVGVMPEMIVGIPVRVESLPVIEPVKVSDQPLLALVAEKAPEQPSQRKWGFGMGAGSISSNSSNSVSGYQTRSTIVDEDRLTMLNILSNDQSRPKTNVKHNTPLAIGFSVNRYLSNRLALQSGLQYSFLSSNWETNGTVYTKTKQYLHFIGVPLGVSYTIAEINKFRFYASAGGLVEFNFTGKTQTKTYQENKQLGIDEELGVDHESVRMKKPLWSVNAHVGVSYPVFRYLAAFAEVGASHYFENSSTYKDGSKFETIRSEKPSNIDFNFGLRINF